MHYFIYLLALVLVFWFFKSFLFSSPKKPEVGFQPKFKFKSEEKVIDHWPVYVPPLQKQIEPRVSEFFEGGKIFQLLLTDQKRLILLDKQSQAYIFQEGYWPQFTETSQKSSLSLFARVATSLVLKVSLPELKGQMEWHVPVEILPVLRREEKEGGN